MEETDKIGSLCSEIGSYVSMIGSLFSKIRILCSKVTYIVISTCQKSISHYLIKQSYLEVFRPGKTCKWFKWRLWTFCQKSRYFEEILS